ncbi:MAG: hypothetical protein WA160_15865 [Pseudobdellovibrio sp.]
MKQTFKKAFQLFPFTLIVACAHHDIDQNKDFRKPAQAVEAKTPSCSVPIFAWTNRSISKNDVMTFTKKQILGALEDSQTKWDPKKSKIDLAGKGMYFSGDPFSSQSFGNHLIIAMLKPNQSLKDLRPVGLLEDGVNETDSVKKEIKSNSKIILHNSSSKTGVASNVVIRANTNEELTELPIEISSLDVVATPKKMQFWKMHKLVNKNDSIQNVLNEYSDQMLALHESWEAWDKLPNDKIVWLALASELNTTFAELAESIHEDHQIDIIEALTYNEEMPIDVITDFSIEAKQKYFLELNSTTDKTADLKKDLITSWKSTVGYKNFLSAYSYLQNYKQTLGIKKQDTGERYLNPSTLDATCHL